MSFISYAQNFEDVMLYRALHDVKSGVYVDVGAQDPDVSSVTRAFYENGWAGVNIEPVRKWFDALQNRRPRDTNLNIAVSDRMGGLTFFEIENSGLSTFNERIAEEHSLAGFEVKKIHVPVTTLADVLEKQGVGDIHFLKVDVEGEEGGVLRGMDFKRWRPWILVIEATEPLSPKLAACEWEQGVLDAGYEKVYFDGLNLYYLALEQISRKELFSAPPNVFDDFISVKEVEAAAREVKLVEEVNRLTRVCAVSLAENQRISLRFAEHEKEIERLLNHINLLDAELSSRRRVLGAMKLRVRRLLLKFLEAGHRLNQRSAMSRALWTVVLRPIARKGYRFYQRVRRRT